jgi:hypothetical protein
MAATVFSLLLKEIEEKQKYLSDALSGGAAKDFSEYKFMCGEIRGLSLAHAYVTDLVRKMEQDEDE